MFDNEYSPSMEGLQAGPVAALAAQLAALGPRFVLWKTETDPKGRPNKVPYQTDGRRRASSTNPATWSTLPVVVEANRRLGFDGVGVMLGDLGDGRHLAGADWDAIRSPTTGAIEPSILKRIRDLDTYAEVSPSGTGVKSLIIVRALPEVLWDDAEGKFKATKLTLRDLAVPEGATDGGHGMPQIELFPVDRYFTLTFRHLDGTPDEMREGTERFAALAGEVKGRPEGAKVAEAKVEIDRAGLLERAVEILDADAKLWAAYETGEKPTGDGKDDSGNAVDFSIVRHMAAEGYDDEEIELIVRHCPFGQFGGGKLNGTNADRRMEGLLRTAAKIREKAAKGAGTLAALIDRYVYDLSVRMHFDKVTGEDVSPVTFTEKWANRLKGAHAAFVNHDDAVKADRSDYRPGEPGLTFTEGDAVVLNRHRPGALVPAEGDFGPILRHFEYLIPDEMERKHILDVLAFVLQNPGQKVKHAIILKGPEGNGKSIIREFLGLIVGARNLRKLPGSFLAKENNFKKQLGNCRVLWVEELMQPGRMEVANDLKEWVTEPTVRAQEKGQPFVEVRTPDLIIPTTNHDCAVYASGGDRRYFVASTNPEVRPREYYDELMRENLLRERAAAFAHYLLARDVSRFNPNAPPPMTEGKKVMLEGSRSALADAIADLMEQGAMAKTVMTIAEIRKVLTDLNVFKPGQTTDRQLSDALKSLGWRKAPGKEGTVRLPGFKDPPRVWLSPSVPELRDAAEIARRWEEERMAATSDAMAATIIKVGREYATRYPHL